MAERNYWLTDKLQELALSDDQFADVSDQLLNEGNRRFGDAPLSMLSGNAPDRAECARLFSAYLVGNAAKRSIRSIRSLIEDHIEVAETFGFTQEELVSGKMDFIRRLQARGATEQEIRVARATADLVAAIVDAPPVSTEQPSFTGEAERLLAEAADRAYDVGETAFNVVLDVAEDARDTAHLVGREVRDGLSRFFNRNRGGRS